MSKVDMLDNGVVVASIDVDDFSKGKFDFRAPRPMSMNAIQIEGIAFTVGYLNLCAGDTITILCDLSFDWQKPLFTQPDYECFDCKGIFHENDQYLCLDCRKKL